MITSRREFLAASASVVTMRGFSLDPREPDLVVPLWPDGKMPGGPAPKMIETIDDQVDNAGLRYRVAIHVTRPTMSYFAAASPTGAAVLITPGGGYSRVGIDREGFEVARWLNSLGIAAFVLRYRLPADRWGGGSDVALQDAQRAMRLIRSGGGGQWKVDPQRVSVLGGSAGGHLAGCLCTKVYDRTYPVIDAADHLLTRPDGAVLLYPVISMSGNTSGGTRTALIGPDPTPQQLAAWSLEVNLPPITPPILLIHAVRDRVVPVDQSLVLFGAIRASGGPIDMHLFEEGSHGLGLRADPAQPIADWPQIVRRWQVRNNLA